MGLVGKLLLLRSGASLGQSSQGECVTNSFLRVPWPWTDGAQEGP